MEKSLTRTLFFLVLFASLIDQIFPEDKTSTKYEEVISTGLGNIAFTFTPPLCPGFKTNIMYMYMFTIIRKNN